MGLNWSYLGNWMIRISKKTEYAIIALVDMSAQGTEILVTAKDISARYNIPREILGKVLQSLAKSNLIESQQGVKGGYQLLVPLNAININKIIESVDGPIKLVDCTDEEGTDCGQINYCNIKNPMGFIQSELIRFFDGITLQDFINRHVDLMPLIELK
jgi:Rrf2 family protein